MNPLEPVHPGVFAEVERMREHHRIRNARLRQREKRSADDCARRDARRRQRKARKEKR